mgnify:CR=1 FL=1
MFGRDPILIEPDPSQFEPDPSEIGPLYTSDAAHEGSVVDLDLPRPTH